jgi:hypothetical protein
MNSTTETQYFVRAPTFKVHNCELYTVSKIVAAASDEFQLELTELQYDPGLQRSFNQETSVTFHVYLAAFLFSDLCKLELNLAAGFGRTYMACVQTFFTHESKEIEVPFKND